MGAMKEADFCRSGHVKFPASLRITAATRCASLEATPIGEPIAGRATGRRRMVSTNVDIRQNRN